MSDSVTDVATSAKTTLEDISEQTKKTLENGEKKIAEVVDEFKKLSKLAKIGIVAVIGSNVLSIAVAITTLRKLNHK